MQSATTVTRRVITHATKVINIGYLPDHVNTKTEYIRNGGWKQSVGFIVSDPSFNP